MPTFSCKVCNTCYSSEKDYFQHLGVHLRSQETIECVFQGCDFKTNRYGTFVTHRSRKHNPHSCKDFKADVLVVRESEEQPLASLPQCVDPASVEADDQIHDISLAVLNKIALLLLKLI